MKRTIIFKPWDVVVVPFPFVDTPESKPRPALVLSDTHFNKNGLVILSMITTKKTPSQMMDIVIQESKSAGVNLPSIVRWKIFTLDVQMIRKKIGYLTKDDRNRCQHALKSIFSL